jgi:hypothetical protein
MSRRVRRLRRLPEGAEVRRFDTQENAMKYMLLMNGTRNDLASFGKLSSEDIRAHVQFMMNLNRDLKASGEFVDGQGLTGPEQAKIVRAKGVGGGPAITDGPFAEAKEFLAGYWLLDCKSLERVIEIAQKISNAPGKGGAPLNIPVELRPVGQAPDV